VVNWASDPTTTARQRLTLASDLREDNKPDPLKVSPSQIIAKLVEQAVESENGNNNAEKQKSSEKEIWCTILQSQHNR
jgi:hypothetical protein